ncbi:MAG: glycosyltransferase family 2 protein [Acidimicrobiales bacterium]
MTAASMMMDKELASKACSDAQLCVVHESSVWDDDEGARTWLEKWTAAWSCDGGTVAVTGKSDSGRAWADSVMPFSDSPVIGPRPLQEGANLHRCLSERQPAVLVVADDIGAAWGVLEARRAGLDYRETVVVAFVTGPRCRLRAERLERGFDLHEALAERIDDHLLRWADVIIAAPEVIDWAISAGAAAGEVMPSDDPAAAMEAVARNLAWRRSDGSRPALAAPLVSAVVTHFNRPDMVRRAIESLLVQTWEDLEILLVDDGSTHPQAAALLDELEIAVLPRPLRVIRKVNGGLGSARNEGLRQARGELVVFLDDDDEAEPTYVERMATALLNTEAVAAVVGFRVFEGAATGSLQGIAEQMQWMYFSPAADLAVLDNIIGGAAAMFRRTEALALGGFHEIKHVTYEDWALLVKVAMAGHDIVSVPEALLRYRVSANSMLRTFPLWGSRDEVFAAFRPGCAGLLSQWPELVYGLHERCRQLQEDRARLLDDLAAQAALVESMRAGVASLTVAAEERDLMLASTSWWVGSNAVKVLRRTRALAGRARHISRRR